MPLVKLDAIASTNDYLKEMTASGEVENYTVVTAENQTGGRGQMGSQWISERGKNLTMSILIKNALSDIRQIFTLNIAVALAVIDVLKLHDIPGLAVKWPNDIMAANKKIGGILIENTIKSSGAIDSIAGIGLNVNQTDFAGLPKASSLAAVTRMTFDKDAIREMISQKIVGNVAFLTQRADVLWKAYHDNLFRSGIPTAFEYPDGERFMAIIKGVDRDGKLKLEFDDSSVKRFGIKELQMLY